MTSDWFFFYFLLQLTNWIINIIKVYITTVFPCISYTATCFDILCHHQAVTLSAPC